MTLPKHSWLAALLLLAASCQVHTPNLKPNVELLDTERQQQDEFVALQPPLAGPEKNGDQQGCSKEASPDRAPSDTHSDAAAGCAANATEAATTRPAADSP